jgi:hypothetical protein
MALPRTHDTNHASHAFHARPARRHLSVLRVDERRVDDQQRGADVVLPLHALRRDLESRARARGGAKRLAAMIAADIRRR